MTETTKQFRKYWILMILMIPGLLCALVLGARRYHVENRNKTVELTLDYGELQNLSVASGRPIPDILQQFKDAGITGVAISEDLLGDLVATGQATYTRQPSNSGPQTLIRINNKDLAFRVIVALSRRLAPGMVDPDISEYRNAPVSPGNMPDTFVVKAAPMSLNNIGIGLSPDAVKLVQSNGLDVIARLQNHPAINKEAIEAAARDLKRAGITRVMSNGDEVFGYRGLIKDAAQTFRDSGLIFGSIEFSKQKGDEAMCRELKGDFVRVHSVPSAEMATMSPGSIVERFERAVKERGIRVCYIRLPETSGEDPVGNAVAFISSIRSHIGTSGYRTGEARLFDKLSRPKPFLAFMGLAVAAGLVLLIGSVVSLSVGIEWGLLLGSAIVMIGLTAAGEMGKQLVALASALIFPTLAVTHTTGQLWKGETNDKAPVGKAIGIFACASAITACGALLIVGLLADASYLVKVHQFMGIKAAHGLPMLFIVLAMIGGLPLLGQSLANVNSAIGTNFRKWAANPLFVWQVIAVVLTLGIVGFALMRTGNDPGVGVSGIELKFRAILDKILVVRPRTKEFLIGHPAFFVGIALLLSKRRSWGLPLVAIGVLGQVSLLNTFCHIHTPLGISVLRAFNGLWLGVLIGLIVLWLFGRQKAPN